MKKVRKEDTAMLKRIGVYFKEKRREKGWNQTELAKWAGIHLSNCSRIERGLVPNVSETSLKKISDALGVKLSDVI